MEMALLLFSVGKLFSRWFSSTSISTKQEYVLRNAASGLLLQLFRNIKPQVRSDRDLDLSRSRDIMGHVIIRCAPCDFLYMCPIDTKPQLAAILSRLW